jgi:hypothetical protein
MANKETLLARVFLAIGQGAGDVTWSDEAVGTLVQRYDRWLDTEAADGKTPQQAWDEHGEVFLARFSAIGREVASQDLHRSSAAKPVVQAAAKIEGQSDCPYCPVVLGL